MAIEKLKKTAEAPRLIAKQHSYEKIAFLISTDMASLFRRFTVTKVYTELVLLKHGNLATKIFVDIRIFFYTLQCGRVGMGNR